MENKSKTPKASGSSENLDADNGGETSPVVQQAAKPAAKVAAKPKQKPAGDMAAFVLLSDVEGVGPRGKVFLPIGEARTAASEDTDLSRPATDGERKRGLLT